MKREENAILKRELKQATKLSEKKIYPKEHKAQSTVKVYERPITSKRKEKETKPPLKLEKTKEKRNSPKQKPSSPVKKKGPSVEPEVELLYKKNR